MKGRKLGRIGISNFQDVYSRRQRPFSFLFGRCYYRLFPGKLRDTISGAAGILIVGLGQINYLKKPHFGIGCSRSRKFIEERILFSKIKKKGGPGRPPRCEQIVLHQDEGRKTYGLRPWKRCIATREKACQGIFFLWLSFSCSIPKSLL